MKKAIYIGIIVSIISILAACEIVISDDDVNYRPTLRVQSTFFSSNYRDSSGRSYICDNRDTLLTYRFRYTGQLDSWRSYLRGASSGRINGEKRFYPYSQGVTFIDSNSFEVTYVIHRGATPLAVNSSKLTPQSIVVIPSPRVIGHTYLHLDLYGSGRNHSFRTEPPLPVVISC